MAALALVIGCGGSSTGTGGAGANSTADTSLGATSSPSTAAVSDELFAVIETNKGTIRLRLHPKEVPIMTAHFVNLANHGYYDGLKFFEGRQTFRWTTGDPANQGKGDPGYFINAEYHGKMLHDRPGTAAFFSTEQNAIGSAFYLSWRPLPDNDLNFPVFAYVVEGQPIIEQIVIGDVVNRITIEGNTEAVLQRAGTRVEQWNKALTERGYKSR